MRLAPYHWATLRLKFCDIRKGLIKMSCKTRTAIIEHRNAYFAIFFKTIKKAMFDITKVEHAKIRKPWTEYLIHQQPSPSKQIGLRFEIGFIEEIRTT